MRRPTIGRLVNRHASKKTGGRPGERANRATAWSHEPGKCDKGQPRKQTKGHAGIWVIKTGEWMSKRSMNRPPAGR